MATEFKSPVDVDLSTRQRSLLLVWQSPASRRCVKVGRLDLLAGDRFAFRYLPDDSDDAEFFALDDYPERDRIYVSDELPAFFAHRVMSAERPSYPRHLMAPTSPSASMRPTPATRAQSSSTPRTVARWATYPTRCAPMSTT